MSVDTIGCSGMSVYAVLSSEMSVVAAGFSGMSVDAEECSDDK